MDTGSKVTAQPRASLISRLVTWPCKGKGWRRWVRLFVAIVLLYNLYACVVLRRPAVHGRVLDQGTGQPVSGAEVWIGTRYLVFFPTENALGQGGGWGHTVTDSKGYFTVPAANCAWWSGQDAYGLYANPMEVFIPKLINSLEVRVYSKDYVTQNDLAPTAMWRVYLKETTAFQQFQRWRIPVYGFCYQIEMRRVTDHDSWSRKCHETLRAAAYMPRSFSDRWLFWDLSAFLTKWPKDKDAAKYFEELMATQPYDCEWLRKALEARKLSATKLEELATRGRVIMALAKEVSKPVEEIQANAIERSLIYRRANQGCIESLVESKDISAKQGQR